MSINNIEVMSILGGLAMRHPTIMSVGTQLIGIYKQHAGELQKITNEYNAAAKQATGPLDQAGIVLQLMKLYPDIAPLIIQVLSILQPHIPELQQTISQTQAQAAQAG